MTTPLLLNPGPVTLTARVRAALNGPDLCHREPEFQALLARCKAGLLAVYPETRQGYEALLIAASGTGAVEAMVGSLVPADGKALVVANGVYGERMAAMLKLQRKAHTVVACAWEACFELAAVEAALDADPGLTHVLAVHHETTTGRLNPIGALGGLCKRHGLPLLLDAVSSFASEELRFEDWNLAAVAATANKCLHGVPGVAFVVARTAAFEAAPSGASSVYLDLYRYRAASPPFTPPIQPMYALAEAIAEHAEAGGWEARGARYRALAQQVQAGLARLGVRDFLDAPTAYAASLTSYRMPAGLTYDALHDHLKARGFVIYAGQGAFSGQIFRIATMGELSSVDMDRLLAAIAEVLPRPVLQP